MKAEMVRGYLYYTDEKGSYRIPVGRRSRKCLIVLDEKKEEYKRSLEIDLFTGFVYYSVDNATSGGLSYYYDMSSKKVGHYFIHRYLRMARSRGVEVSPEELEVFEKLPCADWETELGKLPGWKEAIENRLQDLLLPETEPLRIRLQENTSISGEQGTGLPYTSIVFVQSPAAYPARTREQAFLLESTPRSTLRYRDETIGTEFFHEDEEYERFLSGTEEAWIRQLADRLTGTNDGKPLPAEMPVPEESLDALIPQRKDFVLREVTIRYKDGKTVTVPCDSEDRTGNAWTLQAALRGLLRREIELTAD
ncbi:MAG: hypothetical protein Q4D81_10365 [Eubacteriales bacterium]|nr:hypothetical protein [Eubacteriales bacterium]